MTKFGLISFSFQRNTIYIAIIREKLISNSAIFAHSNTRRKKKQNKKDMRDNVGVLTLALKIQGMKVKLQMTLEKSLRANVFIERQR